MKIFQRIAAAFNVLIAPDPEKKYRKLRAKQEALLKSGLAKLGTEAHEALDGIISGELSYDALAESSQTLVSNIEHLSFDEQRAVLQHAIDQAFKTGHHYAAKFIRGAAMQAWISNNSEKIAA